MDKVNGEMRDQAAKKQQSAMEFLVTYDWALIIIAILPITLYFFVMVPYTMTPTYCTFSNGANCNIMLATTANHLTKVGLILTNNQQFALMNPYVIVNINNKNVTGTCEPNYVLTGGSILCIANLPINSSVNSFVSGNIFLKSYSCGLEANPSSNLSACNMVVNQTYNAKFAGHTVMAPSQKAAVSIAAAASQYPADGTPLKLTATVRLFGYPIKGATVNFTVDSSSVKITPAYALTSSDGIATSYISSSNIEEVNVTATFGNATNSTEISFMPYLTFSIYPPSYLNGGGTIVSVNNALYKYAPYMPINVTKNCSKYTDINFTGIIPVSSIERLVFENVRVNGVEVGNANITVSQCENETIVPAYATQYYFALDKNPADGGSVEPVSSWYDNGSTVSFQAIENNGWFFNGWSGSGAGSYSGSSQSSSITIEGAVTETANFYSTTSVSTSTTTSTSTSTSTSSTSTSTSSTSTTITTTIPYYYTMAVNSSNNCGYTWRAPGTYAMPQQNCVLIIAYPNLTDEGWPEPPFNCYFKNWTVTPEATVIIPQLPIALLCNVNNNVTVTANFFSTTSTTTTTVATTTVKQKNN